jgi:hypothetical protein
MMFMGTYVFYKNTIKFFSVFNLVQFYLNRFNMLIKKLNVNKKNSYNSQNQKNSLDIFNWKFYNINRAS